MIMDKLSIVELLEVYRNAVKFDVDKDFLILLSEELNKRLINLILNDFESTQY
ncbi:sporulation histidine kinase inhibitor Sda [Neobacillus sp. LXY-1]|uniref:sporulation histidine kinase inhibitor Sda n=1 Tax=Neobacillus sp. LXY-1 TaxID=3379133 RepID=UPI003EE335D5